MPLVTSTEMFKKAYEGGYAIGAFNVNNMEIIQGITEAAMEENAPLILQVSSGARNYAKHVYLMKLIEAAIEDTGLPICVHLDHGDTFELCKSCIDGGFTSVMIDGSHHSFEDNIALTKQVVDYAHARGVVVEGELGRLAGIEDAVNVSAADASYTDPAQVEEFVTKTGVDSLAIAIGTSHGAYKFKPGQKPQLRFDILEEVSRRLPGFPIVLHGASSVIPEYGKIINENGRRHRHPRGHAAQGGFDGGLQDQHRLRPPSGDDGLDPSVLQRASRPLRPETVSQARESEHQVARQAQAGRRPRLQRQGVNKYDASRLPDKGSRDAVMTISPTSISCKRT